MLRKLEIRLRALKSVETSWLHWHISRTTTHIFGDEILRMLHVNWVLAVVARLKFTDDVVGNAFDSIVTDESIPASISEKKPSILSKIIHPATGLAKPLTANSRARLPRSKIGQQ